MSLKKVLLGYQKELRHCGGLPPYAQIHRVKSLLEILKTERLLGSEEKEGLFFFLRLLHPIVVVVFWVDFNNLCPEMSEEWHNSEGKYSNLILNSLLYKDTRL